MTMDYVSLISERKRLFAILKSLYEFMLIWQELDDIRQQGKQPGKTLLDTIQVPDDFSLSASFGKNGINVHYHDKTGSTVLTPSAFTSILRNYVTKLSSLENHSQELDDTFLAALEKEKALKEDIKTMSQKVSALEKEMKGEYVHLNYDERANCDGDKEALRKDVSFWRTLFTFSLFSYVSLMIYYFWKQGLLFH